VIFPDRIFPSVHISRGDGALDRALGDLVADDEAFWRERFWRLMEIFDEFF